ncbi:MAG: SurA N-terminal domain-containing protein [Mucilaginibacter sp.]|uniref:SurA N-terminal domain-containing protein n=1 Tax=Mucilaginibacter sp. TaxID=1882438 RepID=UPI0034E4CD3D
MSFLRNRLGVIMVVVIGLALFAFIIGEVVHYGSSFMNGDRTTIGEVAGEKINYDDFNNKLEQNIRNFKQQSNQANLNPQMASYVQQTTWNQAISQIILQKQISKLGIAVGDNESKALIQGNNPSPQIVQAFTNRETGQFDRQQLMGFLSNISSSKADPATRDQWATFVNQIIEGKKSEKYLSLVRNGLYVNSLEAKDDYEARNKIANFSYVTLDYASVPDNQVKLTDDDYNSYYNEHKNEFKNPEETRAFDYVVFNAAPSKADTAAVKEQINKLLDGFKTSKNDSLFVAINAATPAPLVYQKKGQLEPTLDSVMFNAATGFVYGPYFSNGAYKIAKLINTEVGPDSVQARHILINPATAGGVDKALAKADSLRKLIQGGKSFADLAKTYSIDGSAAKGGELGTFARGSMVPVFEDAVFNGKKGDLKIVTSQFGVHLIEIEDQKGSSKVVKVAVVDKPLTPSSKTQSAAYAKAQSFLSKVSGGSFADAIKADKLQKQTADDVTASASAVTGLENARDVVKWAYGAKKGDVSNQVFELGNQYVVAQLEAIKPKGILTLDMVKKQIEPAVRNQVKAKQLEEKLNNALKGAAGLDKVAAQVGGKVVPVQNIVFANPIIPGIAQENKVVGAVFGSALHKVSKPIEGQNGVYVFEVDSFNNPPALNNALKDRQQIAQAVLQRLDTDVFNVLKDKANVKDYRAKFF